MADKVIVDGLREVRRFLAKAGDDVAKDGLKKIHQKVAEPVRDEAIQKVPRRSGDLQATIREAKASATRATVRAGKKAVPYAGPIHFGWRAHNIAPQPFLTDALESKREVVADIYTDELESFIGWLMTKYNLPR